MNYITKNGLPPKKILFNTVTVKSILVLFSKKRKTTAFYLSIAVLIATLKNCPQ